MQNQAPGLGVPGSGCVAVSARERGCWGDRCLLKGSCLRPRLCRGRPYGFRAMIIWERLVANRNPLPFLDFLSLRSMGRDGIKTPGFALFVV